MKLQASPRQDSGNPKGRSGWLVLALCLSLPPLVRMIYFLVSTGVDSLSNDHLGYISVVDGILNGTYLWKNFFRDTFLQGHSSAITVLVQVLFAKVSYFNVYWILCLGVILAMMKVGLLFLCFTFFSKKGPTEFLLIPVLFALMFSSSQVSTYEYDFASLEMGLHHLGILLGIWGLVRYPGLWRGVLFMILGAGLATWTWGGGPVLWPLLLFGMLFFRVRNPWQYLVVSFSALIAISPFFYFLVLHPGSGPFHQYEKMISFFRWPFLVKALGWPFAQGFSEQAAYRRGIVGLMLCVSGIGILLLMGKRERKLLVRSAPGLVLIFYCLLNIWQISVFRNVLEAWYAAPFMLGWIGMLDIAYVFWVRGKDGLDDSAGSGGRLGKVSIVWSGVFIITLSFFYITSNWTIHDKSFFLRTRSPASGSCLRNFRNAPTYCEQQVFTWDPGDFGKLANLAIPLERNRLSVFAPRQRWTLQGDFIQDTVTVSQSPSVPSFSWSEGLSLVPRPFSDYHHLNAYLHSPNSISWKVSLPINLVEATLHSAVGISPSASADAQADGVLFQVAIQSEGGEEKEYFSLPLSSKDGQWRPFEIPLTPFSGQTITIRFGSDPLGNNLGDYAMYRYPYIDIQLNPKESLPVPPPVIKPSNTDLSPLLRYPGDDKVSWNVANPDFWTIHGMQLKHLEIGASSTWLVQKDPSMEFKLPLQVCLGDYSHFYVSLVVSEDIPQKMLQIFYKLNGQPEFDETRSVKIPLLLDGRPHTYTYDLKLLGLAPNDKLTGLRVDPVVEGSGRGRNEVELRDIGLKHVEGPGLCQ